MVRMIAVLMLLMAPAFTANAADSGINPNYLKLKIYKVAISTDALCTNLITVYTNESPEYTDFLSNPTIGSGSVANGTYACVVIEFSDSLKFSPAATSTTGNCVANAENTINVCRSDTSTLIDGTVVTCTNAEERVAMYLSTASTQTNGTGGHTAFEAPTSVGDATKGFLLSGALEVSGSKTGTFVVNGTGKVEDQGGSCDMQPPSFSFR